MCAKNGYKLYKVSQIRCVNSK